MEGNRESGMWVPAGQHAEYEDEDEAEESVNGEARGREEERVQTA